jgi:hypothetical protein
MFKAVFDIEMEPRIATIIKEALDVDKERGSVSKSLRLVSKPEPHLEM